MTITARFPGTCRRCGGELSQGSQIEWSRAGGARHVGVCPARPAPAPTVTLDAQPIAAFLAAARDRGLRFPKARFLAPDGRSELKLVTAGPLSRVPGAINVTLAGQWVGRITVEGVVQGRLANDAGLRAHLTTIAGDPARYAREYGQLTCSCSFCNLPLTDEGSIAAGYGPVCARHYGLPHSALGSVELRPIDGAPREPRARRADPIAGPDFTDADEFSDDEDGPSAATAISDGMSFVGE